MEAVDKIAWEDFRLNVTTKIDKKYQDVLYKLHAKYFKHRYYKPCSCNPNTVKTWIAQLNDIYEQDKNN